MILNSYLSLAFKYTVKGKVMSKGDCLAEIWGGVFKFHYLSLIYFMTMLMFAFAFFSISRKNTKH